MRYFGIRGQHSRFSRYWWAHVLNPKTYYKAAKWFIQRGTRGWADCDTWNLDSYLNEVMIGALGHFKWKTHSHPMESTSEGWFEILTEIQVGFWSGKILSEGEYDSETREGLVSVQKKGLELFVKYYNDLWD